MFLMQMLKMGLIGRKKSGGGVGEDVTGEVLNFTTLPAIYYGDTLTFTTEVS